MFTSKNTTEKQEIEKVEETMDNDKETHIKDNEEVGTTPTSTVPTAPPEDIPEEDEIPELVVDDSEGSEGSVHELLESQSGEIKEEQVKSQNDGLANIPEDPQLDKLEEEEDKKPWKVEDEMTEAEKEYFDKIKSTEVSAEQNFKMAALKVMSDMETFLKSLAFEYLEKVKGSFDELMETVKKLPSSKEINEKDEEFDIHSSLSQHMKAYFGVQPGDDDALRYKLHDMYIKRYDDRNNTFEEQLARRKKVALANLQEQMDEVRKTMLENGKYVAPDPWRLEDDVYRELKREKSRLISDFLDLPQVSYLKEWKSNDTIPLAVTNRWELLTYHLNSIAKVNRNYGNHPRSYWDNKRQKMRNDKDFIIGLNFLGLTVAILLKCYGLVDPENSEDMYFMNIFKNALVYHLMQFYINHKSGV